MSFDTYKEKLQLQKNAVRDIDHFLFLLQRTDNTEILERFFNEILYHINKDNNIPAAICAFYTALPGTNRYVFLTMVADYYGNLHYDTPLSDGLAAIRQTNEAMERKTKWQSYGMMLGGVTFGMEVVMLMLERVTWSSDVDEPAVILPLIFLGFMIFGYPMGRFFKSAHHEALLKQNKENCFEAQYGEEKGQNSLVLFSQRMRERPGYAWAAFGVLAEGLLVFRGILSGIGFTSDMFTLCITQDDYQNKLPGTYFMDTCPEAGGVVCALSVIFASLVTYCLMSGHFALDGRECCEHERAKRGTKPPVQ